MRKVLKILIAFYIWLVALYNAVKNSKFVKHDLASMQSAVGLIVLFIGIFVSCLVGLYLTPQFYTACETASWSFNNSTYEAILDIMFLMVLPILWVVLLFIGLAGASVGVYRMASRL